MDLKASQMKRRECVEKHSEFIDKMTDKGKKQIKFRRVFKSYLIYMGDKVFEDEDEEYMNVQKVGRGFWRYEQLKKTFSKKDFDIVMDIAQSFGAFDY